jgi:NAD(P)-dependent dehydrogenase (short-subunit alcohol dehydrogenase family)
MEGQVALVTGGGSGIGLAVVKRFIAEGAQVAILERDPERARALTENFGENICVNIGDVTELSANESAVDATLERFGRLDTFVGNAGIWDYIVPLSEQPRDALAGICDEIFAVNVKGYVLGARATLDALREFNGNMIFTASSSSFYTGGGGPIYVASKHAVVGLIRQLASELAPAIRVNGVAPGGTLTNLSGSNAAGMAESKLNDLPNVEPMIEQMTPLGFAARPEDHAALYVLLASKDNSRYVTGTVINSDGGIGL